MGTRAITVRCQPSPPDDPEASCQVTVQISCAAGRAGSASWHEPVQPAETRKNSQRVPWRGVMLPTRCRRAETALRRTGDVVGGNMGEFALGQPVSRFEDPRLLRGGGRYVDDMVLPRMAFGHVLRSPHAHARICAIDVSRAKSAPGVLAVLTGEDWRASGWGDLPVPTGLRRRADAPPFQHPFPALALNRVRW